MRSRPIVFLPSLILWLPAKAQTEEGPKDPGSQVTKKEVQFDTALQDELVAISADDQSVRKNAGPGMSKEEIAEIRPPEVK